MNLTNLADLEYCTATTRGSSNGHRALELGEVELLSRVTIGSVTRALSDYFHEFLSFFGSPVDEVAHMLQICLQMHDRGTQDPCA